MITAIITITMAATEPTTMPAIAPPDNPGPVVAFVVVVLAAAVEDADNDMLMALDISVDCTKKNFLKCNLAFLVVILQ